MAELGDPLLFGLAPGAEAGVTVDMLDFEFVDKCKDEHKLRAILAVLMSGKEGVYPELQRATEEKLLSVLPPKERARVQKLRQRQTSPDEVAAAEASVDSWLEDIKEADRRLAESRRDVSRGPAAARQQRPQKPVRGSTDVTAPAVSQSQPATKTVATSPVSPKPLPPKAEAEETSSERAAAAAKRISGYDFRAWERFDVDQYIERMEREEAERAEQQRRQGAETIYGADAPAVLSTCTFSSSGVGHQASGISDKRRQAHVQEMQTLLEDMQAGALSETQCKLMAVREKNKGNECFRCGEHEVAFLHYSRSIALDPTQPAAYTNRAIAAIHLKRYETAEDDCSRALAVDAGFLKAYLRRGMARMHRGHFGEAILDLTRAAEADPGNRKLQELLASAQDKYLDAEGRPFDAQAFAQEREKGRQSSTQQQPQQKDKTEDEYKQPRPRQVPVPPLPGVVGQGLAVLSEVRRGEDVQAVSTLASLGIISPSSSSSASSSGAVVLLKRGMATRVPASSSPSGLTATAPDATAAVSPIGFTRIQIADEDSEEEEEKYELEAKGNASGSGSGASGAQSFTRIAIAEDDDDDDDGRPGGENKGGESTSPRAILPAVTPGAPTSSASSMTAGGFTKVPIQVCSDSEEEKEKEEEEEKAEDVPSKAPAGPSAREDLLREAEAAKARGNTLMTAGQPQDAIAAYSQCITLLDSAANSSGEQLTALRAAAFNNRTMAHLACKRYDAAVADASEVLRVDAGNVKALYRRSLALEALGMQQLSEGFGDSGPAEGYLAQAVRDADAALALETGSNKALQELRTRLIDAIAKRDAWNTTKSKVAPSASSTKAAVGIEGEEDSVEMVVEAARARALGHLQEGRCAEAVAGLQDALARPPLRGLPTIEALRPLLLLLLSSHRSMGDHEGTLACADRILGFEEGNVRALICRAQANLAMGRFAEARRDAARVLRIDASSAEAMAVLDEAAAALEPPASAHTSTSATSAAATTPEGGKASRAVREAVRSAAPETASPSSSASAESNRLKDAGNEALGKDQLDNAVLLYTKALEVDHDNLAALNNRSLALLKLNRFVDAERDASEVLRRDAGNVKALYRRGVAQRSLGSPSALEGALADFDALLAIEPGNKTARAERTKVQQALADLALSRSRAPAAATTPQKTINNRTTNTNIASTSAATSSTTPLKTASAPGSPSLLGPVKNPTKAMSPLTSPSTSSSTADTAGIGLTARSTTIRKPKTSGSSDVPLTTSGGAPPGTSTTEISPAAASPPAASRVSPRAHAESAEKRARMMAAPTQPPKTLYELERVWRGLKSRPDLFAQYLQTFTRSTFREVFKEAITPDLLSSVIAALRSHLVESSPSDALRVLDGLTDMPKFSMTLALLPSTDEARLREAFAALARAVGPGEDVAQVAAKFNMQV